MRSVNFGGGVIETKTSVFFFVGLGICFSCLLAWFSSLDGFFVVLGICSCCFCRSALTEAC